MQPYPDSNPRSAPRARAKLGAVVLGVLFAACGGTKPTPVTTGAAHIALSKDAPPRNYVELQTLTAQSGKGCGVFGQSGSREEAEAKLRNDAQRLGASYLRLIDEQAPRPNHECLEHAYKLTAVAYRAATPAVAPAPPPVTSPIERVCVPGSTQACLGPGACPGAQACRDDASGFLPCDCG